MVLLQAMVEVSVIIPTYERPDHLVGAIETVLGQTHDAVEVVVVDDGSSTSYAAEMAARHDPVRCVTHEENRGAAAARNTGIEAANGTYVAFLDDDDRWHESKLERQVAALEAQPDAGLVSCLMTSVTTDGELLTCERSTPAGDLSDRVLAENAVGSPSRVLVRREALSGYRFDETVPILHDWELFLRICQEWPIAIVPSHLYVRVWHGSLSSDPVAVADDRRRILRKHEALIRERGQWSTALATHHTTVGRKYLGAGDHATARDHLRRAVTRRPTPRRLALLALSAGPPIAVQSAVRCKRVLDRKRHDCPDTKMLRASVSGFPTEDV